MSGIKYIVCTRGFQFDEINDQHNAGKCVMEGEVVGVDPDGDGTDFVGVEGNNRFPGIEISFTSKELAKNFKILPIYLHPKIK